LGAGRRAGQAGGVVARECSNSSAPSTNQYNAWANQRILDTAEHLDAVQFVAKVGASFDSVRDTLVHTMSVQRNWLMRFQEIELPTPLRFEDYPDLSAIRGHWDEIEAQTQAFVASIVDDKLARVIHYVNSQGEPNAYPLWQMMLHQVNHATQHRSEVAVMLTQFGYSPGWLDFLVYVDTGVKRET
jgi:uncharacterized damage-inducible protein DinB